MITVLPTNEDAAIRDRVKVRCRSEFYDAMLMKVLTQWQTKIPLTERIADQENHSSTLLRVLTKGRHS